jgi:hypothetical protein
MSRFNTFTPHPLIPNSQEYILEKKYVSIHSEDRDLLKFPNSAEFEIELPQDYCNVSTVKLSTWTFPSNYNVFSIYADNLVLIFKFNNLYNPSDHGYVNELQIQIYNYLNSYKNSVGTSEIFVTIQPGFYTPQQMSTELQNRLNNEVSNYLLTSLQDYDNTHGTTLEQQFIDSGYYSDFLVVYNEVEQNLWFGNRSSGFIFTLSNANTQNTLANSACTLYGGVLQDDSNWGLLSFLGFNKCPVTSTEISDSSITRFYFGSVYPGDNGFWLTPNSSLPGAVANYIRAPNKLNNMGPAYFYMEIDGLNCMDETSPYSYNNYTATTNNTNGVVNSAFAKIAITTTPLSQWFDNTADSYKFFNPPAERIRKLKIRMRYHNNLLVNFGQFNYSFTLEFAMLTPQNKKNMVVFNSYN